MIFIWRKNMCGRFTLTVDPSQLQKAFPWLSVPAQFSPRYNIAPSQPVAVVPNNGQNKLDFFIWGLIPSWSKDPSIGNRMINARAETLAEKPSFRNAFRRRRCLVLADGFYEWKKSPDGKGKIPMYIQLETNNPFAFAGLWEIWNSTEGSEVHSCTIITTNPNDFMSSIHNRMPVILPEDQYSVWLSQGEMDPKILQPLLQPFTSEKLIAYPVSKAVNNPRNDTKDCIQPITM
jgi:putative SOS response-associated peptidase YedK